MGKLSGPGLRCQAFGDSLIQELAGLLSQTADVAVRSAETLHSGILPASVLPKLWPVCTAVLGSMFGTAWSNEDGSLSELGAGLLALRPPSFCAVVKLSYNFSPTAWAEAVTALAGFIDLPAEQKVVC
jgi:hypothetical protein